MGLWNKLFGKKQPPKMGDKIKPVKKVEDNLQIVKEILKDCGDIIYRDINMGVDGSYRAVLAYVDGMANKDVLSDFVLNNLMVRSRMAEPNPQVITKELANLVKDQSMSVAELKEVETIDEAITNILSGETLMLLDGYDKVIIIASKGWQMRGVSEPQTEAVIRGPRDGFIETLRVNTALIRRRIRDPRLKMKGFQVGERSKTDVSMMYMEDLVDPKVLKEVEKRIQAIDVDAILDSGQVEELIEDNWVSLFPQIQNTERPDTAASAIYHGRVAILVDNSPFALLAPTTFNAMMQSAEDYYERWTIATVIRMLRYFGAFIALFAPALYVGVTSFHPQMLPTKLALGLAVARGGVPFPAIVEALIMEITIEILREAGIRLPGPIGATIGIVGGLVIGTAAVEAGIVGPVMVITVAITAIASFSIPSYNVAISLRILRFGLIFAAGILGLYGIMLGFLLILIHLCGLKSFGAPYLSPFITFVENRSDLKDTFVRVPLTAMNNRDMNSPKNEKNRLDDKRGETFDGEEGQ